MYSTPSVDRKLTAEQTSDSPQPELQNSQSLIDIPVSDSEEMNYVNTDVRMAQGTIQSPLCKNIHTNPSTSVIDPATDGDKYIPFMKQRHSTQNSHVPVTQGGGRRECCEAACACGEGRAPPAPAPHPLSALDDMPPVLRSNPIFAEEEEQEVVIMVDSLDEPEGGAPEPPRVPRRAPSTSSGYGSNGSNGRVSPNLPKSEQFAAEQRLSPDKHDGSQASDSDASPGCTLSRSFKEDIRSCLGGCRWEKDVGDVVEAAVRGAGGITAARARLHAALLALHEPPPRVPNRGPSLPYCGPGVRPGDVTMMPKNTEMSLLAASALFTLDGARGEALSRRLARGERRRRRCRVVLAVVVLLLLLAAMGAVELLMSRGQRVFGAAIR